MYRRKTHFFIHPYSRTTAGLWIGGEPYFRIAANCSDAELGDTVLSALGRSEDPVPHPTQWAGFAKPLLKAAGLRSWKAFVDGAVYLGVEQDASGIVLMPSVNQGAKAGFEPEEVSKYSRIAMPAHPRIIGSSVRDAIANSR